MVLTFFNLEGIVWGDFFSVFYLHWLINRDFYVNLYEKRGEHRLKNRNNRYGISQLIVSHPHKDHISDIQEFDKNFYAHLLTTPNSKSPNGNPQNINWRKITTPDDPDVKYLKRMKIGRNLPLRSFDSEHLKIGYL